MSAIQKLLTDHIGIWTGADTAKRSSRGRVSSNAGSVYGIKKLRELILQLAVRGKLVPQDASAEPASELVIRIQAEKTKLVKAGKIKADKPLSPITVEEKPFELPAGWEWVRLGVIIDYVNGFAFSSKDFSEKGIGVVKIGDIQSGRLESEHMSRVSEDVVLGLDDRLKVHAGDLVIAMSGATTGKLGFNDTQEIFYLNQRVGKIVPFGISKDFLFFDLTTKIAENLKKSFGSAIPNLSTEQINTIVIALPSLAEQHRIVAKVDELMALCDQLETQHNSAAEAHEKLVSHLLGTLTQSQSAEDFIENWRRIAAYFDVLFTTESSIDALKQTLLQLAVMGKLVPQNASDEPASELLKKIRAEKDRLIAAGRIKKDKPLPEISDEEKIFELPSGWEWVRLGTVLLKITDGTHHSPPNFSKGDFKYISAKNIKSWGIDLSDVTYVTKEIHNEIYDRCNPECGDLLYIKDGATTGVGTINTLDEPFSMLSSVALLKPSEGINNKYLLKAMISPFFYGEMRSEMTGVAITRVTLAKLNYARIPLPPVMEQHRIVAKVDELMELCDKIKIRITKASQLQQKLADVVVERAVA